MFFGIFELICLFIGGYIGIKMSRKHLKIN
jgi:hypothetical protein